MKIDRYKDLEYNFFEGEALSPEEEQLLKEESNNPYFSFLKDEKEGKLEMSFDDFLSKAEGISPNQNNATPMIPLTKARPSFGHGLKNYWMAASLVMFMGVLGGYLFVNEESGEITKPLKTVVKQDTEPEAIIHTETTEQHSVVENPTQEQQISNPNKKSPGKIIMAKTATTPASKQKVTSPATNKTKYTSRSQASDYAYNPNYVIINGKPVYNEQEAISLTEDAVNYLASNVSKTVDHAQSVKNLSLDFK